VSRLHVLVADDDVLSLDRIQKRLSLAGFRVSTTDLAHNLEGRIASQSPDLVLIDVLMPGLTSAELVRLLREHDGSNGPRIVLLSPVPPALLHSLVDTSGALAVMHSSASAQFLDELEALAEALAGANERGAASGHNVPLFSGTHRIDGSGASDARQLAVGTYPRKRA